MGVWGVGQRGGRSFYLIFMYLVIPKDFSPEESASPIRTADSSPLKWSGMTRCFPNFVAAFAKAGSSTRESFAGRIIPLRSE